MSNSIIQWYPGHIAKAEKQLSKNIQKVDLVIEVRDARIPLSTSHPHLERWIQGKKHLLVINRKDMINLDAYKQWDKWFREKGQTPWWSDSKTGTGVKQILEAAIKSGEDLNQKRRSRGMLDRPVRALTLGFPNVGKSALINRLMRKKVVNSARRAGVTRSLQWVRLGKNLDLLDAPGVLPPKLNDQESALLLAICDDIGQAAYDVELVAIAFLNLLNRLENLKSTNKLSNLLEKRYGIALSKAASNPQEWLERVADVHTSGNKERMGQRLLDDFRKTLLGHLALELP